MNKNFFLLLKVILGAILIATLVYLGASSPAPALRAFQSPLFQSPLPVPSPTIAPSLPHPQRALSFVAQRQGLSEEQLVLADALTIEFPLTRRTLWRGLVLDTESRSPSLYEVLIDENTREVLTGGLVDPQTHWQAEEKAFRERFGSRVLALVAQREKVAMNQLEIVSGILEHYPLTGQMVWRAKAARGGQGETYEVATDLQGKPVNIEVLEQAEAQAREARYGKLEPAFFYLLQTRQPEENVRVLLWMSGVDYEWVNEELAHQYPQVTAYRFASGQPVDEQGRPMPIEPELFDKIRTDYNALLNQAHRKAAEPVIAFLTSRGYRAEALDAFPGVVTEVSVEVVWELSRAPLENLTAIYSGEVELTPQLNSVGGTIRATAAWESGYTGQGVRIGMMDTGVVNPNVTHRALQGKVLAANFNETTSHHAAMVAGVLVGNHPALPQYRGIAYGSNLLVSAKAYNSWQSIADALNWLVDREAFVISISMVTTGTLVMQPEDRALDYLVRLRDPTVVVAAGNYVGDAWGWNTRSPAKGYNIITVGSFDDRNDAHWSNDITTTHSVYVDPYIDGQTTSGDREKPEVVAVGASVTTVDIDRGDDGFRSFGGTSVAAPQVSGLSALLIQRYWYIRTNPEAVKAIIMASAIHNVEGSSRLSEEDGAGAINAAAALSIFNRGGWGYKIIHNITDVNDPSNPFNGHGTYYDFTGADFVVGSTQAYAGERVRAVICWDSNPASDYGTDPLSTDLDLRLISPSGAVITQSLSWHNSYEVVDFMATETGEYKMRVTYYARNPAEGLDLGLGLAWLRVPQYEVTYFNYPSVILAEPGSLKTVRIEVHNDGTKTWQAGPVGQSGKTYLSYHWVQQGYDSTPIYPLSPGVVVWDGTRTRLFSNLSFGGSTTLYPQVQVPTAPGRYVLMWDMVEENVTWFNWQGTRVGRTTAIVAPLHYVYLPLVMRNHGP